MLRSTVTTSRTVLGQNRVRMGVPQSSWIASGHLGIQVCFQRGFGSRGPPTVSFWGAAASSPRCSGLRTSLSYTRTHTYTHVRFAAGARACRRASPGSDLLSMEAGFPGLRRRDHSRVKRCRQLTNITRPHTAERGPQRGRSAL